MTFIKNFGILGFDASLRMVDPVQFRKRLDDFDFDVVVQRFCFRALPVIGCEATSPRRPPP